MLIHLQKSNKDFPLPSRPDTPVATAFAPVFILHEALLSLSAGYHSFIKHNLNLIHRRHRTSGPAPANYPRPMDCAVRSIARRVLSSSSSISAWLATSAGAIIMRPRVERMITPSSKP